MKRLREFIEYLEGKTFLDYGLMYIWTHPWLTIKPIRRRIKWAFQRLFRGWDDRVVWGIVWYLSKMMPVWIESLKKKKQGIPVTMFEDNDFYVNEKGYIVQTEEGERKADEKWCAILDEISDGFKAFERYDNLSWRDPKREIEKKKFEKALDLLKEHAWNLTD